MLVWEGPGGKLMRVEYTACEWVNPALEKGFWVLQAGVLDSCAAANPQNTNSSTAAQAGCCLRGGYAAACNDS